MTNSNQKMKWYLKPVIASNILAALINILIIIVITVVLKYALGDRALYTSLWSVLIVIMYILLYFILNIFFNRIRNFFTRTFRVHTIVTSNKETSEKVNKQVTSKFPQIVAKFWFPVILLIITVLTIFFTYFYPYIELIKPFGNTVAAQNVDANFINGLLTILGIIFAVQIAFVKSHRTSLMDVFRVALFLEVILLGWVAFSYFNDVFKGVFPSDIMLFLVFFSLFSMFILTGVLIALDRFYQE